MSTRDLLQSLAGKNSSNVCQGAGNARHWHWGRVVAVGATTVDVALDGATVPTQGLPRSANYSPSPFDYVAVDHEGDAWLVTHPVAQ